MVAQNQLEPVRVFVSRGRDGDSAGRCDDHGALERGTGGAGGVAAVAPAAEDAAEGVGIGVAVVVDMIGERKV